MMVSRKKYTVSKTNDDCVAKRAERVKSKLNMAATHTYTYAALRDKSDVLGKDERPLVDPLFPAAKSGGQSRVVGIRRNSGAA